MTIHVHPEPDHADLLLECLQAVSAVHALLPKLSGAEQMQPLALPADPELRAAYGAAHPRLKDDCDRMGLDLAATAKRCTEALVLARRGDGTALAPAASRLSKELDDRVSALLGSLRIPA